MDKKNFDLLLTGDVTNWQLVEQMNPDVNIVKELYDHLQTIQDNINGWDADLRMVMYNFCQVSTKENTILYLLEERYENEEKEMVKELVDLIYKVSDISGNDIVDLRNVTLKQHFFLGDLTFGINLSFGLTSGSISEDIEIKTKFKLTDKFDPKGVIVRCVERNHTTSNWQLSTLVSTLVKDLYKGGELTEKLRHIFLTAKVNKSYLILFNRCLYKASIIRDMLWNKRIDQKVSMFSLNEGDVWVKDEEVLKCQTYKGEYERVVIEEYKKGNKTAIVSCHSGGNFVMNFLIGKKRIPVEELQKYLVKFYKKL